MSEDQIWTLFTQDPRYKLRERLGLGIFLVLIGGLIWQREQVECRILAWRLMSGVRELDALQRLADKGPDAMPYYVDRIDDLDSEIRYKIVLTLKAMRHKDSIPHLLKAATDPDADVRVNAFDAIAEVGGREAIPMFIEALREDDHRIRRVAQNSLHMLTGKTLDYEADSEPEERQQAIVRWESWWESSRTTLVSGS
ncbi:MAG: HEAT repeat domain-containing protein [Planctomycetota bacterium]|nr:HEAT repeat domain-containing protein [Planctomycetota bacterium]